MPTWTNDQRRAIEWVGGSALVSAAAGSGKTSVLAERCAWLVCDAPGIHRCNIDDLLVVTFTREAAGEMRHRIEQVLQHRLDALVGTGHADPATERRLHDQVLLVRKASIGTLHGFCAQLVRQHFNVLGLDPAVRQLDDNEARLLRRECARQLVADRFEQDRDGTFAELVTRYGRGSELATIDLLLRLHALSCSLINPRAWRKAAVDRLSEAAQHPLQQSGLGRLFLEEIRAELADIIAEGQVIAEMANAAADTRVARYGAYMSSCVGEVERRFQALRDGGYSALISSMPLRWPTLPRGVPMDAPGRAEIVSRIEGWRKRSKKTIEELCRFNEDALREQVRDTIPSACLLLELAEDFETRYADAKNVQRAMDFNDLERFTLQLLRNDDGRPTPLAVKLRQRYRHVLVDEYQDINEVQDEILRLLSTESSDDRNEPGNLFCVGDVKQSIYRFRLADPTRFLRRLERLAAAESRVINLKENFRSRGPLLDCINAFFERVMTRDTADIDYDASQQLNAAANFPPAGERGFVGRPIEVLVLPSDQALAHADGEREGAEENQSGGDDGDEEETLDGNAQLNKIERQAAVVASQVRALVEDPASRRAIYARTSDNEWASRPLKYGDIAVLLRSTRLKAVQFAEQLRRAGVPVFAERRTGFFDALEVRDIISLLEVLINEHRDVPLAAVLRGPLLRLDSPDDLLAKVRVAYPARDGVSFAMAVHRFAIEKTGEEAQRLSRAMQTIARWRELAFARPVADLLDTIFEETGYLVFVAGLHDGEQRVANLLALHDRARQFAGFQRQSLQRFLDFLLDLREHEDLGEPSVASATEAVRVMSIHQSKGLEFPVVFIADLDKAHTQTDLHNEVLMDRELGLAFKIVDTRRHLKWPSLAHLVLQRRLRRQMLAEEMRVLYVAMTRAKEALWLVCEPKKLDLPLERKRWSGHEGPMPTSRVLSANNFLDWIVPVSLMDDHPSLVLTSVDPNSVSQAIERVRAGNAPPSHLRAFIAMQPLKAGVPFDARASDIVERVLRPYPQAHLTNLPAATTVSALTKPARTVTEAPDRSFDRPPDLDKLLELPRSLSARQTTATERGTATHLALQHLDFSAPLDAKGISSQLQGMVERRLLTSAQAASVDVDAIEWFATTPLGKSIVANPTRLQRELSILFPEPGSADHPLDRVMIRGRIDAMLRLGDGLLLLDYKTDRVQGDELQERADSYAPQVRAYREALVRLPGTSVRSAHLVFLHARAVLDVR